MSENEKRRRFQFSPRFLLSLLTLAVALCAVVPDGVKRVKRYVEHRRAHQFDELIDLIVNSIKPTTGILTENDDHDPNP